MSRYMVRRCTRCNRSAPSKPWMRRWPGKCACGGKAIIDVSH